ncbi:MAG: aminoacyl-tRNA hydrolase [Candidatus Marinimicrobia bacterium]|jgi:PTH1 family peptidyl-tRNA hydrolase|nr:aminoacyl-tRNA hydrolase [Candidatus Neomarinimicrobiota bacterium]MDP6261069.1 aminoacyl-tRNA hydrolase [Candidatus Neomarinimicrobiota bacterium]MDP7126995.1 aminoacyl-tRNA hydrolase [Candidatus Neomarinimicrobiota bacterium]MDP7526517.1 aminoacyl-tRNA hydrolase [Candidatus Neomarinimicrobiota bacterium]MEE1506336.1 aminoacyl-tRNA hydrolase [Candidatus Neomarinimicrobiota bacterium]
MTVLVGLGNPGRNYSDTKHNFGFWVLDKFAEKRSLKFQAGKGDYLLAKKGDLVCIKPTIFMNTIGVSLLDVKQFFKAETENFLVVYDDIDLPLGTLRFRKSGGTGGHKGIESIIYQLQSEDFNRLRMGIATDDDMRPSEKYVLTPFQNREEKLKNEMLEKACEGIDYFLSHDMKKTMNKFNEKQNRKEIDE